MTDITATLDLPAPPDAFGPAAKALWWLAKSDFTLGQGWTHAHEICQDREGEPLFDRIHGLAHLIEEDSQNAAYWYRRADVPLPADIPTEWAAIAAALTGDQGPGILTRIMSRNFAGS